VADAVRQESQQATTNALQTFEKLIPTLQTFETNARTRLSGLLQLLSEPSVSERIENAAELRTRPLA
jgi:hypothetical protein